MTFYIWSLGYWKTYQKNLKEIRTIPSTGLDFYSITSKPILDKWKYIGLGFWWRTNEN